MGLLSQSDARDTARELFPGFRAQRAWAEEQDRWYRGRQAAPQLPAQRPNGDEYGRLRARSITPLLGLVVTATAQALYVDGHRVGNDRENSRVWTEVWQPNGLDSRQIRLHRASLSQGIGYNVCLPGTNPLTGAKMASIKGVSAKKMAAFYDDEGEDDFPTYALRGEITQVAGGDPKWMLRLYDDTAVYFLSCDEGGDNVQYIEHRRHDLGLVPVVAFPNLVDLDGQYTSEIAPLIPVAQRYDQDTFDRLVVQRYGSWRVRWATGVQRPATDDEARAAAAGMRVDEMLINESPDGKFGTLDPTEIKGYIDAADSDLRTLAAVSQTPPHHLLGQMANLSAEALAAAEASLMRKVDERKTTYGEAWEQTLRMAAWIMGDTAGASDFSSQVRWRDTESRSLSQAADALGKLAQQLGIPSELLWGRVPGWTDQDTADAKKLLEESGELEALYRDLVGGQQKEKAAQQEGQPQPTGGAQ